MQYQKIFQRSELKYLLTRSQVQQLKTVMEPYMAPDLFAVATIRNLYYDTENYRMIRRSLEKPVYKEKLRIRCYQQIDRKDTVFVELKKKYQGTVYKRRLALPYPQALDWLEKGIAPSTGQIAREIEYVRSFYGDLQPRVFLSYDREAYACRSGTDLRITLDDHIRCRQTDLCLTQPPTGALLLPEDRVLMEIKTSGGIPLWLTQWLTQEKIYKTSFSKYGTAYETIICQGGNTNAGYIVSGNI